MKRLIGPTLILLCTVVWGSAFVAQKLGADHFGPFAISCYRNLLAGAFLWGGVCLRNRRIVVERTNKRAVYLGGTLSGIVLFAAMLTQQLGIERTTPGISAFLTANYVLFVPVLAWLIGRGRPAGGVWIGVVLALVGTYFLSFSSMPGNGLGLGAGEAWTLACAVLFSVQILVVDRFARSCDVLRFSMVQMFVAGLVALPFVLLPSELARTSWADFARGLPALVYLGIFSSGIAYTLQNLGQARTPPALAAIIMSLESVFGVLFGWLLLGEEMTVRQLSGCALVFSAVVLSQLIPSRR